MTEEKLYLIIGAAMGHLLLVGKILIEVKGLIAGLLEFRDQHNTMWEYHTTHANQTVRSNPYELAEPRVQQQSNS
jgi:hypothetical protein